MRRAKTRSEILFDRAIAASDAASAQELIHAAGDFGHITVRAFKGNLLVQNNDGTSRSVVARLDPLGLKQFALYFRTHAGRWEPMPASGRLEDVVLKMIRLLGPYLLREDYPLGNSGTSH